MKTPRQIHWTLARAEKEFGTTAKTLSKDLKLLGIEPTFRDGTFSTMQICAGVFGDIGTEKLLLTRAQRVKAEVEAEVAKKTFVPIDRVRKLWSEYVISCRALIANSELNEQVKEDVTASLADIPDQDYFKEQIEAKPEQEQP